MIKPMTTLEASEVIGISRHGVLHLISVGTLKAYKHGRDWQVDPSDVVRVATDRPKPGKPGRPKKTEAH